MIILIIYAYFLHEILFQILTINQLKFMIFFKKILQHIKNDNDERVDYVEIKGENNFVIFFMG